LYVLGVLYSLALDYPNGSDPQWSVVTGYLIANGEIPYRDFFHVYSPLYCYMFGLTYKLVGYSLTYHKIILCLIKGLVPVVAYYVFYRISNKQAMSFFVAILFILFNVVPTKFWLPISSLITIYIGYEILKRLTHVRIIISGLFITLCFLMRHDFALVQAFIISLAIFMSSLSTGEKYAKIAKYFVYNISFFIFYIICGMLPFILYMYLNNAIFAMLQCLTTRTYSMVVYNLYPFTFPSLSIEKLINNPSLEIISYFYLIVPFMYVCSIIISLVYIYKNNNKLFNQVVLLTALMGLLLYPKGLYTYSVPQASQAMFLFIVLSAFLLLKFSRIVLKVLLCILVILFVSTKPLFDFYAARAFGFFVFNDVPPIIDNINDSLPEKNEYLILDTISFPLLYPIRNQPLPSYWILFVPGTRVDINDDIMLLSDVIDQKVKYVIWTDQNVWALPQGRFANIFPITASYIKSNSSVYATIGSFYILEIEY